MAKEIRRGMFIILISCGRLFDIVMPWSLTVAQIIPIQTFMLKDGILWKIGSQERNLKDLSYWIGKRAQTGKKTPSRFNKDLKFLNEIKK